jgi:hypothetical protein
VVVAAGPAHGNLVVWAPASLEGAEIEIRTAGGSWDGQHVAVRRRDVHPGPRWAALFGGLAHGRYELRLRAAGGPPDVPVASAVLVVDVAAPVTEACWPDPGA